MPLWTQNLLIFLLVGGCLAFVGWQAVRALIGRRSRIGSCCSKGCSSEPSTKPATTVVQFLPVEMLTRRK